jgi:radical SAM protein with 4Fe4S-binding SPASM domain
VEDAARPGDVAKARLDAMFDYAVAHRVPLNGSIAMTHRCHLRCVHCYLGCERQTPPARGELDTAFWCSVVDQVAEAGCLNLLITGGEPLLRPDFARVYRHARERGILVTVFTNATLVDEPLVRLFEELPPQEVEVTLYGASEDVYERVTGVKGSYRRCLAAIDRLLERGVPVGLKSVILTDNQHEMSALRQMATDRGVDFRVDGALFPGRDGDRGPLDHRVPAERAVAIEMEDEGLRSRTAEYFERTRGAVPAEKLFDCTAGITSFHVDSEGTLLPCLMVATHGFDLRQGTFREGWEGVIPRFQEQEIRPGFDCHTCDMRFLCGACPAQAGLESGSPHRKAEYLCRLGEARFDALGALGGKLDK